MKSSFETSKKEKPHQDLFQISTNNEEDHAHSEIMLKRWEEALFHENHIIPRSYHSAVVFKSYLYVYGGYESNQGILNDFYSIHIESKDPFVWKLIERKNGIYPGLFVLELFKLYIYFLIINLEPLHRHTAIIYEDKMYIYGGKLSVLKNSDKLFCYDFSGNEWSLMNQNKNKQMIGSQTDENELLPFAIDSHNAALYQENEVAEMIIFGGFLGKYSKYSNNIFAFDFKKNEWKFYFKSISQKSNNIKTSIDQFPKKRTNSSIALMKNYLYVFGGCKGSLKMNDLWKFDLILRNWQQIFYDNKVMPEVLLKIKIKILKY